MLVLFQKSFTIQYDSFVGWHLRGHVFGDTSNVDSSVDGLFDSNYRIWLGILYRFIQV